MMKTLLYISVVTFILASVSCKKDKEEKTYVISGTILKDCSMEPLANTPLHIMVDVLDGFGKKVDGYFLDTDANGNFSFVMHRKGTIDIRNASGMVTYLMAPAPSGKELHLGSFIARPTTSFVYRIKVNNPYNVGDTLYLSIPPFTPLKGHVIPAPLQDSTFETIYNYSQLASYNYGETDNVEIKFGVTVSKNGFIRDSIYFSETRVFNFPACPSKIDTITLVVD